MYKRKDNSEHHRVLNREVAGEQRLGPKQVEALKWIRDRQLRFGAAYQGEVATLMGEQRGSTNQRFATLMARGLIEETYDCKRGKACNTVRFFKLTKAGEAALR